MITYPIGLINPKVGGNIPVGGLVGEWLFNGNADDTSGNGNDGTVVGATLTTDRKGNANSAYLFTNTNYIDVSSIGFYPELSISIWFRKETTATNNAGLFCKNDLNSNFGDYDILAQSSDAVTGRIFAYNDSIGQLRPELYWFTNEWSHVVISLKDNYIRVTLDNVTVEVANDTLMSNNFINSRIGGYYSVNNGFRGTIDSVRFYDKILSLEEITQLYNE